MKKEILTFCLLVGSAISYLVWVASLDLVYDFLTMILLFYLVKLSLFDLRRNDWMGNRRGNDLRAVFDEMEEQDPEEFPYKEFCLLEFPVERSSMSALITGFYLLSIFIETPLADYWLFFVETPLLLYSLILSLGFRQVSLEAKATRIELDNRAREWEVLEDELEDLELD